MPYKIVLADDHSLVREAVKLSLEKHPDLEVIGEAQDGLELLGLLKHLAPDLVILDVSMPNLSGLEAVGEIKKLLPGVKIMMLTMYKSGEYLHQAITSGVHGYLLKENALADLHGAIQTIRRGGTYISPLIAGELRDMLRKARSWGEAPGEPLSHREIAVLRLLAEGKSSRQISDLLFISVATVNTHRHNIRRKLNLKTNAELIKYALQRGYLKQTNHNPL
jgi:DNA-binding NarL/FixJ family response regulator